MFGTALTKFRFLCSVLRAQPFDVSTSEGRANERHRRVALSAATAVLSKSITVLTALVSVPLTLNYLGDERYGLWMTASSLIAVLTFADLGIGNGLLNRISEAYGNDDRELGRKYVSSAFFMLAGVALLLGLVFSALYPFVDWKKFFNLVSPEAIHEAGPATIIFVVCFLLNLPLGIVARIQLGYQEGFINNLWTIAGSVLALGGLLVAIGFRAGLPWLVLAMAGAPVLVTIVNGAFLFLRRRPWLLPKRQCASIPVAQSLFRIGAMFFVLQATYAITYPIDNFIAAHVLDQKAVTTYSIVARLFSFTPMIMDMFLNPLWPAYGEAIARGDYRWVKKTLTHSMLIAVSVAVFVATTLALFGHEILRLWVGPTVAPPFALVLGFAVWTVLSVAGNAVAMFLNGIGVITFEAICAVLVAIGAFVLKIVIAKSMGLAGIIWGTIIAYIVFAILPFLLYVPRLLKRFQISIHER